MINNNQNAAYIKVMVDTLGKKEEALKLLTEITKEQELLLKQEKFSMESFEEAMERKRSLIESLNQLDDGFEAFFKRIEVIIQAEKEIYRNELIEAQKIIGRITDMSVKLQAMEARNKEKFAMKLADQRQEIRNIKVSSQTAGKYYQHMANQHQEGQSYFMDKKK